MESWMVIPIQVPVTFSLLSTTQVEQSSGPSSLGHQVMNYSNKTMEFVLPFTRDNSWDIHSDKLNSCKKQSFNDDVVYFKIIGNNIINDNNQCLFNTISIDQQQIFLNFFDELVSNKNKLFESSINESTDANEKKMIKSKLDILTKESLGLEFKKI